MNKSTKILLAVLVTVSAVFTVLPEQDNYYQAAIELVSKSQDIPENQLQLQSGYYKNFMLFKTVDIHLNYAKKKNIHAVIKQTPWTDWTLNSFEISAVN